MRNRILKYSSVTITVLLIYACGQKSNLEQEERKLIKFYQKDSNFPNYPFGTALTELILSDTSTINYPFQQLKDSGYVNISTSKDGNLRFYSWVTPFGGTMFDYDNVFQYRSNGKVYSFEYTPWDYDENNNYTEPPEGCLSGRSFVKIHTVIIGNKTYYLVEDWARYDSGHGVGGINAFTIENDNLKLEKIFRTKNDILNSIEIKYCFRDWYFVANNDECFDWLFSFDEKTNTLYVPLINNNISFGYVTDQYLLYQLKENYFQYIGKGGGYWIHPSIRTFDHLLGIYDTERFKIRVDYLGNDNYRYVSWAKGKTMVDKPDLIIENGVRIDDWRQHPNPYYEYIFENKEFVYKIHFGEDKNHYLIVEKNEKEILKEKMIQ